VPTTASWSAGKEGLRSRRAAKSGVSIALQQRPAQFSAPLARYNRASFMDETLRGIVSPEFRELTPCNCGGEVKGSPGPRAGPAA
jgi:hypothetical protein